MRDGEENEEVPTRCISPRGEAALRIESLAARQDKSVRPKAHQYRLHQSIMVLPDSAVCEVGYKTLNLAHVRKSCVNGERPKLISTLAGAMKKQCRLKATTSYMPCLLFLMAY